MPVQSEKPVISHKPALFRISMQWSEACVYSDAEPSERTSLSIGKIDAMMMKMVNSIRSFQE